MRALITLRAVLPFRTARSYFHIQLLEYARRILNSKGTGLSRSPGRSRPLFPSPGTWTQQHGPTQAVQRLLFVGNVFLKMTQPRNTGRKALP